MQSRLFQKRGTTYVIVLMTSVFVTIAALSGLSAARAKLRTVEQNGNVNSARFYAQTGVEMGIFAVSEDANWRTSFTHNTWENGVAMGEGGYTFKLFDEDDGDLQTGGSKLRLYGKGICGESVRVYSVEVEPVTDGNLIGNGDMDAGGVGWDANFGGGSCDVKGDVGTSPDGSCYSYVSNRSGMTAGPSQDITAALVNGSTYYAEFDGAGTFMQFHPKVIIGMETSTGYHEVSYQTSYFDTSWHKANFTLTPTWTGTLESAYLKFETTMMNADFKLDNIVLVPGNTPPPTRLVPVTGTWRREPDS